MNILQFLIPKSMVVFTGEDSTVRQAMEKMRFHRYVAIPVLDREGRYLGTLRNDDIFRFFLDSGSFDAKTAESTPITAILQKDASSVLLYNAGMAELVECVKEHNFVSITDDRGCFIGIILRRDVLNYLLEFYHGN